MKQPSDELVTEYVLNGTGAAYVESFAAENRRFAKGLAAVIDAFHADRALGVSREARRWRVARWRKH